MRITLLALSLGVLGFADVALAHPGGLNREGCHNDRKRGGYHCHDGGRSSVPAPTRREAVQRFLGDAAHYGSCAAVRAAGVAPLRRGDPGYRPGLDRDHDGVACE